MIELPIVLHKRKHGLRVKVNLVIHDTLRSLRAALCATGISTADARQSAGFFESLNGDALGRIHVTRKSSLEVVGHEVQHAIVYLMQIEPRRLTDLLIERDKAGFTEEALCYVAGGLVSRIWEELQD